MKKLTEEEVFDLQTGSGQRNISDEDRHFFDTMGYLVLEDLLAASQAAAARHGLENMVACAPPKIRVHMERPSELELLNVIESGGIFEDAMALPRVLSYLGELIWGNQFRLIASRGTVRNPGSLRPLSQGGRADARRYVRYRCFREGEFRCLMLTCLIALSDTRDGDGTFCLIPASHKSNLPHPYAEMNLDDVPPLREIPLRAGSGILFSEGISHAMKSPGRETQAWLSFQYGPSYMLSWPGCEPSYELQSRVAHDASKAHLLIQPYYHPPESQKKGM